jgi:hypothetical protein
MNCANHQQTPAAAYCRTCGKPLCTNCTRPVMGVIYCENCVAEKMAGTAPPASQASYSPPAVGIGKAQPLQGQGPHPPIAGLLAGFFPFGVGAVYCGQYAKGLAHLIIFVLLIIGASNAHSPLDTVFGLGIAAFWFYQLFDAIKSAKAIQAGQTPPDPFGLGTMFSVGDRQDFTRGVPTGALVLIGLGVLFLLHNLGVWYLEVDTLWPVILIALGVWLFVQRKTAAGSCNRGMAGPVALITWGIIVLIDHLHGPSWNRTWPVILLVIGIVKLMERSGHGPYTPMSGPPPGGDVLSQQQPPASEVNNEVKNG